MLEELHMQVLVAAQLLVVRRSENRAAQTLTVVGDIASIVGYVRIQGQPIEEHLVLVELLPYDTE
ncbi:hypothetical protein D3C72_2087110 [compost metagenome]